MRQTLNIGQRRELLAIASCKTDQSINFALFEVTYLLARFERRFYVIVTVRREKANLKNQHAPEKEYFVKIIEARV